MFENISRAWSRAKQIAKPATVAVIAAFPFSHSIAHAQSERPIKIVQLNEQTEDGSFNGSLNCFTGDRWTSIGHAASPDGSGSSGYQASGGPGGAKITFTVGNWLVALQGLDIPDLERRMNIRATARCRAARPGTAMTAPKPR